MACLALADIHPKRQASSCRLRNLPLEPWGPENRDLSASPICEHAHIGHVFQPLFAFFLLLFHRSVSQLGQLRVVLCRFPH